MIYYLKHYSTNLISYYTSTFTCIYSRHIYNRKCRDYHMYAINNYRQPMVRTRIRASRVVLGKDGG